MHAKESILLVIKAVIESIDSTSSDLLKVTSNGSGKSIEITAEKMSLLMYKAQAICSVHGKDLEAKGLESHLHEMFYALDRANKIFSTIENNLQTL